MSRIYTVTDRLSGDVTYVRAKNLNAAVRAVANDCFLATASTTDEVYAAMKGGAKVLDALAESDTDESDPGPVPMRAA